MGMFDEVEVPCPRCGDMGRVQSKEGPCILKIYNKEDVPAAVAQDVDGKSAWCDTCHDSFTVRSTVFTTLWGER